VFICVHLWFQKIDPRFTVLVKDEVKPNKVSLRRIVAALRPPVKWYRRLTLATAGAIWFLIVLGGLVRVTESGEGCGNSWPMCHGHLIPNFEYHEMVEWTHRLMGFLVGWLMVATILVTFIWYRRPRRLFWMAFAAGVTYVLQAVLGGLTVLLRVGHTWTALHMGNSMLLVGATFLLAVFAHVNLEARGKKEVLVKVPPRQTNISRAQKAIRWWALGTLVWTYIALFSGSAVVGADATVACPSWPQCSETQLLPSTDIEWINFTHRLAVGLSDVMLLGLAVVIWRTRRHDKRLMNSVHALGLLYISQVFLGAFTVLLNGNPAVKSLHLSLAAATWGTLVVMVTFLWMSRDPKPSSEFRVPSSGSGESSEFRVPGSELEEQEEAEQAEPIVAGKAEKVGQAEPVTVGEAEYAEVPGSALSTQPSALKTSHSALKTKNSELGTRNSKLLDYIQLMRPNVIPLLIVPTVASMLIAAAQHPTERNLLELVLWTTLGGTLATGGAHSLNQYLDRDIDARMRRTRRRAVVTGKIPPRNALYFGIALTIIAVIQLALTVNLTAAALSLAGNLFYVLVYTMWLKRTTTQNIVIGGAAGAVPPLVGWAAVTGGVSLPAVLFFAIIFFWTPAHFWALALVRQEDYREAGVPMLPVVKGEAYTRQQIVLYSILLVMITLLPFLLNALGYLYLAVALSLGALFVMKAFKLLQAGTGWQMRAYKLFKFSNTYLAALYVVMVIDRLLALGVL
jgi:protoheme IX farnesyltransferase